jgi:hypothetical protein
MTTSAPGRIAPRAQTARSAFPWRLVVLLIAGGAAEFALLALWQRNGYWDFSDGVYAQSAREVVHGLAPYRDFAAAQPPPVYLLGALLLLIHDRLRASAPVRLTRRAIERALQGAGLTSIGLFVQPPA